MKNFGRTTSPNFRAETQKWLSRSDELSTAVGASNIILILFIYLGPFLPRDAALQVFKLKSS
jgi:hypothetical protein